jgi:hypothetical protein
MSAREGSSISIPFVIKCFHRSLGTCFSDVWGPALESIGRKKNYLSFIDDFSKFVWAYTLKQKLEVFECFRNFQNLVERLFYHKILAMHTD